MPTGQWNKVDDLGGLITIDWAHHEVHDGEMYICSVTSTSIANDAWLSLATNGAIGQQAHFTFGAECGGDAIIQIIEYTKMGEYSTAGTDTASTVAYNMNRNMSDTFPVIKNSSVISSSGVILAQTYLPAGKGPSAQSGGAGTRADVEFITHPDKAYLVRMINKSGAAKGGGLTINFYSG